MWGTRFGEGAMRYGHAAAMNGGPGICGATKGNYGDSGLRPE
jgi:hypothetical protein